MHERLGNARVAALVVGAPESGQALYLQHLLALAQSTELDMSSYLPWNAPLSWSAHVLPFYEVAFHEQQREASAAPDLAPAVEAARAAAPGGGQLAEPEARDFERTLAGTGPGRAPTPEEQALLARVHGKPVAGMRLHEGPSARSAARAIGARAFAVGHDVYLGERADVSTPDGAELLAHEATHVVQAQGHRLPSAEGEGLSVSSPADTHEREADAVGRRARREAARVGEDPWGLGDGEGLDPAGRAILAQLRSALPAQPPAPPAALVHEGLVELLRGRMFEAIFAQQEGAADGGRRLALAALTQQVLTADPEPATLARWVAWTGAPAVEDLDTWQARFAPYPTFAAEMGRELTSIAPVTQEAAVVSRDETEGAAAPAAAAEGEQSRRPSGPPTFRQGQEVWIQVEPDRWRRGIIQEVREPEEEEEGESWVDEALASLRSEENDGWQYVVAMEDIEGCSEQAVMSDDLHDAEALGNPGPSLPGPVDEVDEPEEPQTEPGQDPNAAADEEGQESDTDEGQEGGQGEGGEEGGEGGGDLEGGADFPMLSLPGDGGISIDPGMSVDAGSAGGISREEDAYYEDLYGISLSDDIATGNASIDEMVCSMDDEMGSLSDMAGALDTQGADLVSSAQSDMVDATAAVQDQVAAGSIAAQDTARSAADAGTSSVDEAAATATATIADISIQQQANLDQMACELERDVQGRQGQYAEQIDTFIQTERDALQERLNGAITALEAEATEEEAEGRRQGQAYSGSHSGAAAEAERIAGLFTSAKIKKRYVKALKRIARASMEDLDAQIGEPSRVISGDLHNPTISQLWPAMEPHQEEMRTVAQRNQEETDRARETYGSVTTRAAQEQTDVTTANEEAAQQTVDAAATAADQNTEAMRQADAQRTDQVAAQVTDERRAQLAQLQQALAGSQPRGPASREWSEYVAQYETRIAEEEQATRDAMADEATLRTEFAQDHADQVTLDAQASADTLLQSTADDTTAFAQDVQEGATATNVTLQDMQDITAETATEVYDAAVERNQAAMDLLQTDGERFFQLRVQQNIQAYGQRVDAEMTAMTGHMQEELQSATSQAQASEKSDRERRQDDCWGGVDYTWGTDEERLMRGVSGVTKVQGYALQYEFQQQHGETLREAIIDDTSGSLMRSLLAWIEGNEVVAAREAMNYANEGIFGPDSETVEIALRGVSEEGRQTLASDEEFQSARTQLQQRYTRNHGTMHNPDYDTMLVLSDTSRSRDSALMMADAIRLEDAMDHPGTDEEAVYRILGQRDQEGNEQLARAFAEYHYDRWLTQQNGGRSWDQLSDEEREQYAQSLLRDNIQDEFSRHEEDRATALLAGNQGAAIAAQMEGAASGSNDMESATQAMTALNQGRTGGWLDQADYAERRGEFMGTVSTYQDDDISRDDRRDQFFQVNDRDRRQQMADDWETNRSTTRDYIADEFGDGETTSDTDASRRDNGYGDSDEVSERILLDQFDRGQADERDLMQAGIEGLGTREVHVRASLQQIVDLSDANVRLARLNSLGAFCWNWVDTEVSEGRMFPEERQRLVRESSGQMGGLPPYVAQLEEQFAGLRRNVQGIMLALNWETDGGEQFDMELLIVRAMVREQNVTDLYSYARQQFLSMMDDGDENSPDDPSAVSEFTHRTPEEANALLARQRDQTTAETAAEGGVRELSCDDQLRAHLQIVDRLYHEGMQGDAQATTPWFDAEGWLIMEPGATAPSSAVTTAWTRFQDAARRVDVAKSDLDEHERGLINAITMVVGIIAAIAISVVSLGSASAASAALIGACIALASGAITVTVNLAIAGDRYGAENMLIDIGRALADAAVNVLTMGVAQMARVKTVLEAFSNMNVGMRFLVEAARGLPGELTNVLFNESLWDRGAFDDMATQLLLGLFASGAGGTLSSRTQALGGIEGSAQSIDRILGQVFDNFFSTMADPRNWESEDLGWQLLQAVAQGLIAGAVANGIRTNMVSRLNSRDMGESDWSRVQSLEGDERAWMLEHLDTRHAEALERSNPSLHSSLYGPSTSPAPDANLTPADDEQNLALPAPDENLALPAPDDATPVHADGDDATPVHADGDDATLVHADGDSDQQTTPPADPTRIQADQASRWAEVQGADVIGHALDGDSTARLEALGYIVQSNGVIRRPNGEGGGENLPMLRVVDGVITSDSTRRRASTDTPAADTPAADSGVTPHPDVDSDAPRSHAEISDAVQASTEGRSRTQDSADPEALYRQAADADVELRSATEHIADATDGEAMFPPGLKGRERATEKAETEYGGDWSQITDLSRSSIQYDSMDSLYRGLETLSGQYEVVRIKDRFQNPTAGGYRDMLLNVRMSNGHVVEVQLHLRDILTVKNGRGHAIYEESRAIDAAVAREGRDYTPEERARQAELTAESEALYNEAYQRAQSHGLGDDSATGLADAHAPRPVVDPDAPAPDTPATDTPAADTAAAHVDADGATPHPTADSDASTHPDAETPRSTGRPDVDAALAARDSEGGQQAVTDMVRGASSPEEAAQRMQLMRDFEAIMRVDPADMTAEQRDTVLRAQSELNRGLVDATEMRKVIPESTLRGLLSGDYSPHVGGSVADARNTEGLSPAEMVQRLGLDYTDEHGNQPYMRPDGEGGVRPVDEVITLDMPMTDQLRDRARVPMDESMIQHAQDSTDPEVRRLYDEGLLLGGEWQNVRRDETGARDPTNPYAGHGATATAPDTASDAPVRANQELQIPTNRAAGDNGADIPPGGRLTYRGPDGEPVVLARYDGLVDGRPHWTVSDDIPADLRARLLGDSIAPVDSSATVTPGHPDADTTPAPDADHTSVRDGDAPDADTSVGLDASGRPLTDAAHRATDADGTDAALVGPDEGATPRSHAEISDAVRASTEGRSRTQDSDGPEALYRQAADADVELRSATERIAEASGGEAMFPPGLKGRERATEKAETEYGGDWSQITDLSRSTIQYDSMDSLYRGLETLSGQYEVVHFKDRFQNPADGGYRDMLLNVRMSNGHVVEVQLHLRDILAVKGGRGHAIYEEMRGLRADAVREGRDLTPEEVQRIETLAAESEALYGEAYQRALSHGLGDDSAGGLARTEVPQPTVDTEGGPSPPESGSQDRTEAGFLDRLRNLFGLGSSEEQRPAANTPPAQAQDPATAAPADMSIVTSLVEDRFVQTRPGSAAEARLVKDGFNLVIEIPPGRSPAEARADVQRQLTSEAADAQAAALTVLGQDVEVSRTGGSDVSYNRRGDGTVELRLPYGFTGNVEARLQQRRADADQRLQPTTDLAALHAQPNTVVGVLDSAEAGHAILQRLNQGDPGALAALGIPDLSSATFDFNGTDRSFNAIEWGLGQLPDGRVVIIRGNGDAVDWGGYPDVVALAHSHPTVNPDGSSRDLNTSEGSTVPELLQDLGNCVHLLPSSGDINYVHANRVQDHVVHTPYAYDADSGTVQAAAGVTGVPVDVVIRQTREDDGRIVANAEIRAGSEVLWSGDIVPSLGFSMPAGLFNN